MNAQRKAIKARNEVAQICCEHPVCPQFRCGHTQADVYALLAELADQDVEIERLTNRLQRSS